MSLTRDYDRSVDDARRVLAAAESMAERARFLASVIERAGLALPPPERSIKRPAVRFYHSAPERESLAIHGEDEAPTQSIAP